MSIAATIATQMVRGAARAPVPMALQRHAVATAALRRRELDWWAQFGASEERYFWGVTDSWQPLARLRYIDRIAADLAGAGHVVDYGCGSGWLARALADRLQRPVTGLDFSPAQIALAGRSHADSPWLDFATIAGPQDLPRADAYVFHGLLHHLSTQEIHALLCAVAERAAPGARLHFIEPTCFPEHQPDARDRVLLDAVDELVKEPWRLAEADGVVVPPALQAVRAQGESRWWGEAPFGPSPMEKPFEDDELDRLLGGFFDARRAELVQFLPASQALAGEIAMLREADAGLADALAPSLMAQVDALERVLMRMPSPPDAGWYMAWVQARAR